MNNLHWSIGHTYRFLYFRTSPRGNSKFGLADIPWQRLRVQQQGTDEEIYFDQLWILRSQSDYKISYLEEKLKDYFNSQRMSNIDFRAGHTEWFYNLNYSVFEPILIQTADNVGLEIQKINLLEKYGATKASHCPLKAPASYSAFWFSQLWENNKGNMYGRKDCSKDFISLFSFDT